MGINTRNLTVSQFASATNQSEKTIGELTDRAKSKGFGVVAGSFKLFNEAGDEFSLSVDGNEVCIFRNDAIHATDATFYPADAKDLVAMIIEFLK